MTQAENHARLAIEPEDLIDWPRRLATERPFLLKILEAAPSRRVLDLGCGAGHHARLLAEAGFEVVAMDASEAVLDRARAANPPQGVEFLLGDMGAVERSVRGHFGAAICLGNTIPGLLSAESISRMLVGLKRRLLPEAPVVLQTLNYDRSFAGADRALPVEVIPSDSGEIVVQRLVEPREDGIVVITTAAMGYRPSGVPPMAWLGSRAVQLKGWKREELSVLLDVARLPVRAVYGAMDEAPYEAERSRELVIVAG